MTSGSNGCPPVIGKGYSYFAIGEDVTAFNRFRRTADDVETHTTLIVTREGDVGHSAIRKRPFIFHSAVECKPRRIGQNTAFGNTGYHGSGDLRIDQSGLETAIQLIYRTPSSVRLDPG